VQASVGSGGLALARGSAWRRKRHCTCRPSTHTPAVKPLPRAGSAALRWLSIALIASGWIAPRADDLRIDAWPTNGVLSWSGPATNGSYRVEWAPTVEGPWTASWATLANVPATGNRLTAAVPMFYRVVYSPPPPLLANVAAAAALNLITNGAGDSGFVVLDVRTPAEYAVRHVRGARNHNFYAADFAAQLAALDRQKRYLVYCASGSRSGQATAQMHGLGFAEVYNLTGGFATLAALPASAGSLEP
jgi:phage shock protein E